jgi:hypothetical protein
MPPRDVELQVTTNKPGQEVTGRQLRPYAFETIGAITLETGDFVVAIKL